MSTAQGRPFSLVIFALQWAAATGLGWLLSLLAFALRSEVPDYRFGDVPQIAGDHLTVTLLFGLAGLATASCQAWVLRRHVPGWQWWVVASTVASLAGGIYLVTSCTGSLQVCCSWLSYPAYTSLPVGVAQGVVLLWLSLRHLGRHPVIAIVAAVSWALARSAALLVACIPVGFAAYFGKPTMAGWAAETPICMGLPFGFLTGLLLAVLVKPRARQAPPAASSLP